MNPATGFGFGQSLYSRAERIIDHHMSLANYTAAMEESVENPEMSEISQEDVIPIWYPPTE